MDDKLVPLKDAAERLGVTYEMLRSWIRKRQLPIVKVGSLNRVRQSNLDEWIRVGLKPVKQKASGISTKPKGKKR